MEAVEQLKYKLGGKLLCRVYFVKLLQTMYPFAYSMALSVAELSSVLLFAAYTFTFVGTSLQLSFLPTISFSAETKSYPR